MIAARRAGHIKEVAASGAQIGTHGKGTGTTETAQGQRTESTVFAADIHPAATQRQVTDARALGHVPGRVTVDGQRLDIVQIASEDRIVTQRQLAVPPLGNIDIANEGAGVGHAQVEGRPCADVKIALQRTA
ncbi:hypothetical protein D3C77_412800 [compost metagenome]